MKLFEVSKYVNGFHGSNLWMHALKESFSILNEYKLDGGMILDCGGGNGWLSEILSTSACYFLIELNKDKLNEFDGSRKICADLEKMPITGETFDVIVSISTCQYLNHDKFLSECFRVLKPGGILMLHENGAFNPFILIIRACRYILSLFSSRWRAYNSTIYKYLRCSSIRQDGLQIIFFKPYYLASSICWITEYLGMKRISKKMENFLLPIDEIFLSIPILKEISFLNVYHIRKVSIFD